MMRRAAMLTALLILSGPPPAVAAEPVFEMPAPSEMEATVREGMRDALDLLEGAPAEDPSPPADIPPAHIPPADVPRGIGLLDVAQWGAGDFVERGRELRMAAAESRGAERVDALLALARFHLAWAMAEEGIGAVEAAGGAGTPEQRHQLRILRDAFAILDGSAVAAETVFVRRRPVDSADHLLWRCVALAEADADPAAWRDARPTLPEALRRLLAYPGQLRARLLVRLADGAAADADGLERIVVEMTTLDDRDRAPGLLDHYEGRMAELRGRVDTALSRYDAAAAEGGYFGRRAQLRAIGLRHRENLLDEAGAIAALESLRYAWRGDEVEAAALGDLGTAYLAVGRGDLALMALDLLGRRFAGAERGRAASASARILVRDLVDRARPAELIHLSRRHDGLLARIDPEGGLRHDLANALAGAGFAVEARRRLFALAEGGAKGEREAEGGGSAAVAAQARVDLARLWILAERPADALSVLADGGGGKAGALLRAEASMRAGRHIEAIDALRGLDGPEPARLRGRTLFAAGEWHAARGAFAEAIAASAPERPEPDDVARLALAAFRAGDGQALREASARYRGVLEGTRWDGLLDALAEGPGEATGEGRGGGLDEETLRRELAGAEALIGIGRRWVGAGAPEL